MISDFSVPNPSPGDDILPEHVLAILEVAKRLIKGVVPPLTLDGEGNLMINEDQCFWAKITGSPTGTAHPWIGQIPATGGTWSDDTISGTASSDPAYEANGSTADLTGKYVYMKRERGSTELRFIYGAC